MAKTEKCKQKERNGEMLVEERFESKIQWEKYESYPYFIKIELPFYKAAYVKYA